MKKVRSKNSKKSQNKKPTIFVQVASYRDPQLPITIDQMLERADNPEMFSFGICWQYDSTEDITKYDNNPKFRIRKHHYSESEGLGWARAITNELYDGEDLVLQIDSHHRFLKGWDTMMLEDYYQALQLCKKPVLSTYLTPFRVEADNYTIKELNEIPCLMSQYEFSPDKLLMSRPWHIMDYKSRDKVIRARTISGHFFLTDAKFIKEVPYDPDIYFGGYVEETTLSLRAFTWGYDVYSPYRQYIWHEYTRNHRPKHWEDHGTKDSEGFLATKKTSGERDNFARQKTRQLFGQEENNIEIGKYGLGSVRTLQEFELFGGFDFKKCRIQDYTLKVNEPPNPTDWENQFISRQRTIKCVWDVEFFRKANLEKPELLTLGILSNSGTQLFRRDFHKEKDPFYVDLKKNSFDAVFHSIDIPSKIVMYLYDPENKQWSERYEQTI